jgi:TolA-binding protein
MMSMNQTKVLAVATLASVLASVWSFGAAAQTAPMPVPAPALPIAQAPDTLSARTLVRLDQLSRQLSEATGRIEALEAASAAQKAENTRLAGMLDAARAAQAAPAPAPASAPVAETRAMTSDQAAAIMATPQSVETGMFVAPTPPPIAPAIMLTNARTALQGGNYPVAEANLTQLIWVYPASPEASEGRWLLGETRFVQSAWGTAAQAYVDYLKASPQGPRASEALLRLAGSFRQLGDNRQRCIALAEFKRRTPRPDATLKARADGEIARMTCPPA